MSVLTILSWPDRHLKQKCQPVGEITSDIHTLADDMLETMYAAPGRGLAAPQVGVLARLFVMDATWKDGAAPAPEVFLNPEILAVSDDRVSRYEGCLSLPGVTASVERPARVKMSWQDLQGHQHQRWFDGFAAACVQHELDHLDGIVTLDRIDDDARARVLRDYGEVPA